MRRRLIATALGTAGFSMQDILLEPYGGKILHLPVGATTAFTAMLALGGGVGLMTAARRLTGGADPHRLAGIGALVGVIAFSGIVNDIGSSLAVQGVFGEALADPVTGYALVYTTEILLLFATLVALGPLVRLSGARAASKPSGFELSSPSVQISGVLR
jgi:hypothetical protein